MINIFIVNYNSSEKTKDCIRSICLSNYKEYRIILINNYSTENDYRRIIEIYESYRLKIEIYFIANTNVGYSGGNNSGLNYLNQNKLGGDILILNPDVILSVNTISEMIKALTSKVGIVTVRTLNSEGQHLYDAIHLKGFLQKSIFTQKPLIESDYSQGACLLIRRVVANQTGLFDPKFFLYWEEVDFSLRVKKAGWQLVSTTKTQIIRKNNSKELEPSAFYYSIRNAKIILKKHRDYFNYFSYFIYLSWMFLLTFKFLKHPKIFFAVISKFFAGIIDSWFKLKQQKV